MTIQAVTKRLSELSIPTKGDSSKKINKIRGNGQWTTSTISGILSNETYIGTWHYGKTRSKKLPNGKRKLIKNPREEWIAVSVPAIVESDIWHKAQAKKAKNKKNAKRNRKYDYLLAGHVTCGKCGGKIYGMPVKNHGRPLYLYYRCIVGNGRIVNKTCNAPYYPVQAIDNEIWQWVRAFITNPEKLQKGIVKHQNTKNDESEPLRDRLKIVQALIQDNQSQLKKLIDLYLSGEFAKEMLVDKKKNLEDTINSLEVEQSALETQLQATIVTEEQINNIQNIANQIGAGVSIADNDFQTRRQILDILGVQVVLDTEGEDSVMYVTCDFGQKALLVVNSTNFHIDYLVKLGIGFDVSQWHVQDVGDNEQT